ncbi:MAG: hypothetical protein DELT_01527 [Desulfovibrio sp.]
MEKALQTYIDRYGLGDHYTAFMGYARTFYTGKPDHDVHLALKVEHSRNVFCHACAIAEAEAVFVASPDMARSLALAGLYHDFGRFMQYVRYRTFDDKRSVNHAKLAVHEVKRHGMLKNETRRVRNLTLAAVLLHNRFETPPRLDRNALTVTNGVRDADKLDIMRIMAAHLTAPGPVDPVVVLGTKESPEVSAPIVHALMERRLGSYSDMRTTTDFKLLVCAWFYDLNYAFSRNRAITAGHLRTLFDSLPETEELAPFKAQYARDLAAHDPAVYDSALHGR